MVLGVIGGLGPMATARFMEMVTGMTDALCDQEHIEMLIHSCPQIPDRTAYILGKSSEDPVGPMVRIGNRLAEQGADCIAIPCITAHYFMERLSGEISVPVINAVEETGRELKRHGVERAGIMATDGTVRTGLFQNAFSDMGIETVVPDARCQQYVMDVIYENVKQGIPADLDKFCMAAEELRRKGAQVLILGCTELSLVNGAEGPGSGFLDAMEVLARSAITLCGGKVKKKYENLITG